MHTETTLLFRDAFTGPDLDAGRWSEGLWPLPDGSVWPFTEPHARTTVRDGELEITISRFSRYHDREQQPDNAKHFIVSRDSVPVTGGAPVRFSAEMSAEQLNTESGDYRDGFGTFCVCDYGTGMVFDLISTGSRVLAVLERLPVPGVAKSDGFTYVIDAPLDTPAVVPGRFVRCDITFDPADAMVSYVVDGRPLFTTSSLPAVPRALNLGLGMITLQPIVEGRSTSLRGQGLRATWRRPEITRLVRSVPPGGT